jgi:predicted HTH transcriptional regulator
MAETKQERLEKWNSALVSPKALFDRPDLALLCAKNIEGQYYERKSKRDPERLAETICGFANSNREYGGLLAVGISDDGVLEGVCNRADININRLLEYHHYTGTTTQHRLLRCIGKEGRDDEILLIYVPYLENRVAETSNGKAFVRKGDKTIELRDADKRELEYTKEQISALPEFVWVRLE